VKLRNLILRRPLVALDLETTGTGKDDRIVQIGLIKVYPDGKVTEWETLVNPGVPILREATEVHGITDEMVANAPRFSQVAGILVAGLRDCDIAGFNVTFDIGMIERELIRIKGPAAALLDCGIVDGYRIYKKFDPHNLESAVRKYLKKEHEKAHSALPDARVALELIDEQVAVHNLPTDPDALFQMFFKTAEPGYLDPDKKLAWKNGEACINFGKAWNGVPLRQVQRSYLEWMLGSEFPVQIKDIIREAMKGNYPKPPEPTA
jgi:DNA polymerase-3 subunit epsilon